MEFHVPITEDLVSVLDRVLDKSIVVDSVILMGLQAIQLRMPEARVGIARSAVYLDYGNEGSGKEGKNLENLFPFWRRDLWTR